MTQSQLYRRVLAVTGALFFLALAGCNLTTSPFAVATSSIDVVSPASITVNYQPHDGSTATATLVETGATQPLDSGSAVFDDLSEGTYTVQVDVTFPNT